jgi:GH24 family phage-related lysozyme (muramidase)
VRKIEQLIRQHEGVRRFAYRDSSKFGLLTIGAGRNIDSRGGLGLSEGEISFLLGNDIKRVEGELRGAFRWFSELSGARRDATIGIAFNLGLTSLRGFVRALDAMSEKDYSLASNEFMDSRWSEQVGNRAIELCEMIETGEYQSEF